MKKWVAGGDGREGWKGAAGGYGDSDRVVEEVDASSSSNLLYASLSFVQAPYFFQ